MRYSVRALRADGAVVNVSVEARDTDDAGRQAGEQGLAVLSVRSGAGWFATLPGLRPRFALLLFSQELHELLDAGISLVESLETLAEKETRSEARRIHDRLLERLREGQTFSSALQAAPEAFPALYVATVRASEKTGDLRQALTRYVAYESQLVAIRDKLVSALIYPALLLGVGLLVMLFLLGYVVPRFSQVYEDLGDNLPAYSQWMMQWGRLVKAQGGTLAAMAIGAVGALVAWLKRPATCRWLGSLVWRIPTIGERLRIYQLARFYRTLGMLLRGGMAIVPATGMVSGLLQPALRERLGQAVADVREGHRLSVAMEARGLTTPIVLRMLRVGERTGRMGEMMERIARFYDEEQARWIEWFTKLVEPVIMAMIGLVIGGIVVMMYMPIFGLAVSIQ